jgi:mannose-1-phosphate guanylyltransferase
MKAFLLAAGEGARLRPVTNSIPKCLVPIRQEPLLAIWIELCRRSGICELLINLHAHADAVRQFIASKDFGVHISLIEEHTLLGSAGTIVANRAWVESEEIFWIFYADVLTNMNLSRMLAYHHTLGTAATMALYKVPNPSQCGIVEVDNSNIIRGFVEKPQQPASNLAFTGVMIGTPRMLDVIPSSVPADLGFDVFPKLIGSMAAYEVTEYLIDIGTVAKYEAAQSGWPGLRD